VASTKDVKSKDLGYGFYDEGSCGEKVHVQLNNRRNFTCITFMCTGHGYISIRCAIGLIDKSGMGDAWGAFCFPVFFQLGVWGGQLHWSKSKHNNFTL
jgi:hypothetical protein